MPGKLQFQKSFSMLCQTLFSVQTRSFIPSWDLNLRRFILFCIILAVRDGVLAQDPFPPRAFSIQPKEGTPVEEGFTKTLICKTSSIPRPAYRWLKDDVYLSENSTSTAWTFRIQSVSRNDSGVYRCEASNELGSVLSAPANIKVAYMDDFLNKDQSLYVHTNESNAAVIPLPYIDSYPAPTVIWYENSIDLQEFGQRYHVTLNKSLVLLERGIQDSNFQYQPSVLNGQLQGSSIFVGPYIYVTVSSSPGLSGLIAPTIVVPPQDRIVDQNRDSVEFECVVNARPVKDVIILWYKIDGQGRTLLSDSTEYAINYLNRTLFILSPGTGDNGVYECEARVSGLDTVVTARATLTVYVSPSFTTVFPDDFSQDLGDTISIPCMAQGFPTPTIHWYRNAQKISPQDTRYILHDNGTLTVSRLDLDHAGVYQCFIRNEAGETSKSTWLRVNSAPPTFVQRPVDITVIETEDAKFQCETRGAPKPIVTWSRDIGNGYVDIVSGGKLLIINGHELLITTTESSDSGEYRCNASNSQGSEIATARLTVFVKTQITRPPQNQTVTKSTTAVLPCGVSHDPDIVVTWTWSFRPVNQDRVQRITPDGQKRILDSDGTLRITGINNGDIGNYTCDVVSQGGNDSRTVTLKVVEKPFPPIITNVTLHPTDVRAVVVTWQPQFDGNTPILRYSIEYKVGAISRPGSTETNAVWLPTNIDIGADDRSVTVPGLKPAQRYQFRLYAENMIGEGNPSDPMPVVPIEMPQQPPSSPPKGFFGIPASNSSIYLQWQPPAEDTWNGPLIGYTIRHKIHGYDNTLFNYLNVTNLVVNPTYELGGLAFYEEYDIQIAAFNIKGVGVFSNSIQVRTLEGRPTAPPNNLQVTAYNSTTLELTWTPPDAQFINGRNMGYKVYARIVGATPGPGETLIPKLVPPSTTNLHRTFLYDLHKFTEYSVTVVCYTSQGDGPRTPAVVMRTQEDVPGLPGSLYFFDIRDNRLNVTWSHPDEINGILQGYTLTYMEKDNPSTRQSRNLSSLTLSYTITGLAATTKYTISVYASTRKGAGPARSADIESGVPPETPGPPLSLGVSNIRAHSVLLQFIPGFDGKTSITLWIVEALEVEESTQYVEIYTISDPTARSIQVENLRPYTKYKIRVIAENIANRSEPSLPTREFQTLQAAPGVPPGSVTVRAVNSTALRVSWTPLSKRDWNGEPKGYKVYYKMVDDLDFVPVTLDNGVNLDSTILAGLEEWMEYEVKMLAFNDVGDSNFSPVTVERTRESVPSTGPANVTAVVLGSTNVSVSWEQVPKLDQNGLIEGYRVMYQSREESINPRFVEVDGGSTMSVVLENLRKYVQYEIYVMARTRMGVGAMSSPEVQVRTDEDVPGPPVIVWFPEVTYTLAEVVWEPPLEPNGIITGYMVSYKLRDGLEPYQNSSVLSNVTTSYTVGNLQREAYYEFRVTAKTRLGWGETASVEVYTMVNRRPPDSPDKPSIRSSQINARNVTISWRPAPFNGYGPTRNFTVQYKLEDNAWSTVPEAIMPSLTTYTVTGLRPNSRYVFRVAATNDRGQSPYSVQSDPVTTLEDKPEGAPRFVEVKPLTTTSVRVSWEQPLPDTWNGAITGYIINFKQTDFSNYQEEKVNHTESQIVLDHLIKFKNYEFIVTANNSIGKGPASTPVTVYVGEAAPTAAPTNIRTEAINSTEILVSWSPPPPDTQNGELSGYKIYYWLATAPESTAKQNITREQSILIRDLHIYTDYAVVVQAFNLAGDGPKSSVKYQKSKEDLPGRPAAISFWNVTYVSLDVSWMPPQQPNGIITRYELAYVEKNPTGGSKQVKFDDLNGTQSSMHIGDLSQRFNYKFSLRAFTSIGQGEEITKSVITGPQTGSPGKPQRPELQISRDGEQIVTVFWVEGLPGDYPTYGYIIESKTNATNQWEKIMETTGPETQVDISFLSLNPDSKYQFRVTALNIIGISEHSEPSMLFRTPAPSISEPEPPFHTQFWFPIIVALVGAMVILVITFLLCLSCRRNKRGPKKPASTTSTSVLNPAAEPEEGGFGNFEMTRQSQRPNNFASLPRGGAKNGIYARSPPRPSPASVAYNSDDDRASTAKAPLPDDDDDSSMTEKPSEFDSTEPSDQESDEDSLPPPPPPASPPPPPFSAAIRTPYDPSPSSPGPPVSQNWPNQNNSSFNAYQYTDSEAESSHYAFSLNGGQIMLNNTAGSRAPLPGFSSFV